MFETAGALAIVQPVLTLIALIALPLLWAIVAGTFGARRRSTAAALGGDATLIASIVSITCATAILGLAIVLATRLALLPRGYVLVQHVSQLARLGQLDLAFDLALDPRSATLAIVIAMIGCASTFHTAWSSREGGCARLAWSGLITAGTMLLVVGDGFAPILIGLGLSSLGGWGLSKGGDPTSNGSALTGNIAVLLGLVFLFWSLGGAFGSEGYDADGAPRFVLVATGPGDATTPTKATLVMTTHTGALVSSDDADLPHEPIAAPFSVAVEPGLYTLRVQGGVASGDVVVPRVALVAGRTHVLAPYGPTASLRALDDQVAVPRLAPGGGGAVASIRAALASRTIGGLRASAIVLLLVLGGALAHAHALASRRGPSAIAAVLEAIAAPYLALRLSPLVDPSAADGALVAVLGAGSAVILSARAACVEDGHASLRSVLAAGASVALAATGLGEPSATLVLACSTTLGTGAALAAIDARRDVRWLGVACAAAVGLLPGAGASPGFILAITAALGSAATGSVAWAVFSALVAAALVSTCTLAALAAFRVYDAVIRASVRDPGMSRGQGVVVVALSVVALVAGTALGAGTTSFGGQVIPLARRLVGGATLTSTGIPKAIAGSAVLLSLIAAAGGVLLARRVSAASSPPRWLIALGRPYSVMTWTAMLVGNGARFLSRSVGVMDRDIIEDIPIAIGEGVRRVVGLVKKEDPKADAGAVPGPILSVNLETDDDDAEADPKKRKKAERFRTILLAVMVALLTLVVLSSMLLGW